MSAIPCLAASPERGSTSPAWPSGIATATPVPTLAYTFSTLKFAQALGDFDALTANGREVVHYHLDDPATDFAVFLERLLAKIGER